jgi:hypothetical protein
MADADETMQCDGTRAQKELGRVLPDPRLCSLRLSTGIPNLAHCVVERPAGCKYAVGYGLGYLCSCPQESETHMGLPDPSGAGA